MDVVYPGQPLVEESTTLHGSSPSISPHISVLAQSNAYRIDPIGELPTVNASLTIAAVISGRRKDTAFNKWIVRLIQRNSQLLHLTRFVWSTGILLLFVIKDDSWIIPLTVVVVGLGVPSMLALYALLSWDLLCLLCPTFEFAYLMFMNWSTYFLFVYAAPDVARALGMSILFVACTQVVLCLDATLHLRPLVIRGLLIGAVVTGTGLCALKLGWTPMRKVTITIFGIQLNIIDLIVNNMMTMACFFIMKAVPSLGLVKPGSVVQSVCCEVYHPVSALTLMVEEVPRIQTVASIRTSKPVISFATARLKVAGPPIIVYEDITKPHARWVRWLFPLVGHAGFASTLGVTIWHLKDPTQESLNPIQYGIGVFGMITTFLYWFISVCHYEWTLFKVLLKTFAMWFISVQAFTVTGAACDMLEWNNRIIVILPLYLWCHWLIHLDAIPHWTRRHLGIGHVFVKCINLWLVLFPFVLSYWIYFSNAPTLNRDISQQVGSIRVDMQMATFLAHKIATIWVWMCRFLWRELFLPRGAFTLIRQRVEYQGTRIRRTSVPSRTTNGSLRRPTRPTRTSNAVMLLNPPPSRRPTAPVPRELNW